MAERGDVVRVLWWDIEEDPVGNPETAKPKLRSTYGVYWAEEERDGVMCLVTTTTLDSDGPHQQGYCVYPMGVVKTIEVIRRARRRKKVVSGGE